MAIIIAGESRCPICGKVIDKGVAVATFPAFLPRGHELSAFSDAAFHRACFDAHPSAARVKDLYARYQRVWDDRPRDLKTLADVEAWQRAAFGGLWSEAGFRPPAEVAHAHNDTAPDDWTSLPTARTETRVITTRPTARIVETAAVFGA
jgi:hypothetical protein